MSEREYINNIYIPFKNSLLDNGGEYWNTEEKAIEWANKTWTYEKYLVNKEKFDNVITSFFQDLKNYISNKSTDDDW